MLTFSASLPPKLIVNPPVINETDSVTLNCQTPSSVSVSQCYFHIVRGEAARRFSCLKTLTGTELLKMSHQSSPAEVEVMCFYTVKFGETDSPSPHSDTSSITIHNIVEKEVTQDSDYIMTSTMTTGLTVSRPRASTLVTPAKQTSGSNVSTPVTKVDSYTTTTLKTTSAKLDSDFDLDYPDLSKVPSCYHNLKEVFKKSKAMSLPPHRSSDLLLGAPIPKGCLYSISGRERAAMDEYITTLLKAVIIYPPSLLAGAGFFFVGKKDGFLRPCIDYSPLNDITVKKRCPLPLISSTFKQPESS
ncbi:hypothetical protein L3Q82_024862 [Scortum barcoo]|uniref:Uncharacterized protein n=1 Tax=Scortum barcoo TaxID=214431 RepID=A0ACB8WQP1_9TELE|nr:hypothetical protein L3Q82_024862 [Scortum barcoo]